MASTIPPRGCSPAISSIYYNLCDLSTVWGVAVEAVAAAGVVTSFVLFIILMASLPFVSDKKRKGMVVLQASVLVFTLGLFGLSFAFIVGRYSTSCVARRFLFGVLFSGPLSCLIMHGLWLALLQRRTRAPRSWMLCLGALSLWLVEVIINTEWLLITVARGPPGDTVIPNLACSIANKDFVMALIYVMVLLVVAVIAPVPSLVHKDTKWRRDGCFILVTGIFTTAIWVSWIVMFTYGNQVVGNPSWDDPTLAVAVVANAWTFLFLYTIPEICLLTLQDPDQEQPLDGDHIYPASLVYDNILKEPEALHQNIYMENKAFSMEEPPAALGQVQGEGNRIWCNKGTIYTGDIARNSRTPGDSTTVPSRPVSPYGAYNGQPRSCVYQPTEIALIAKGLTRMDQDTLIPRAAMPSSGPPAESPPP